MASTPPIRTETAIDAGTNSAKMSSKRVVASDLIVLAIMAPVLLSFRRGMIAVIRAIERTYNLKPHEELIEPYLVELLDERIEIQLRRLADDRLARER